MTGLRDENKFPLLLCMTYRNEKGDNNKTLRTQRSDRITYMSICSYSNTHIIQRVKRKRNFGIPSYSFRAVKKLSARASNGSRSLLLSSYVGLYIFHPKCQETVIQFNEISIRIPVLYAVCVRNSKKKNKQGGMKNSVFMANVC